MTEFIRNNPLTTAHIATEVVLLGGLLYYSYQVNKNLTKAIMSMERRLALCERALASKPKSPHPSQPQPSQPHPPPPRRPQPPRQNYEQHHHQPQPQLHQQQTQPPPQPFNGYVKVNNPPPELDEESLDQVIEEELGKLVNFVSSSSPITDELPVIEEMSNEMPEEMEE